MIDNEKISAQGYPKMIAGGAVNLKEHVQFVNHSQELLMMCNESVC